MFDTFNHAVLLLFYDTATSSEFARWVAIFFAEWFPFLVIISAAVYEFFIQEDEGEIFRSILRTLFAVLVVWIIVLLAKIGFSSPRPFVDTPGIMPLIDVSDPYGSFPSAHAAVFGTLAGSLLASHFHVWRWFLLAAILIAMARVAVGVHWPSDVIVGTFFGLAAGFFITQFLLGRSTLRR